MVLTMTPAGSATRSRISGMFEAVMVCALALTAILLIQALRQAARQGLLPGFSSRKDDDESRYDS